MLMGNFQKKINLAKHYVGYDVYERNKAHRYFIFIRV